MKIIVLFSTLTITKDYHCIDVLWYDEQTHDKARRGTDSQRHNTEHEQLTSDRGDARGDRKLLGACHDQKTA